MIDLFEGSTHNGRLLPTLHNFWFARLDCSISLSRIHICCSRLLSHSHPLAARATVCTSSSAHAEVGGLPCVNVARVPTVTREAQLPIAHPHLTHSVALNKSKTLRSAGRRRLTRLPARRRAAIAGRSIWSPAVGHGSAKVIALAGTRLALRRRHAAFAEARARRAADRAGGARRGHGQPRRAAGRRSRGVARLRLGCGGSGLRRVVQGG